MKMNNIVNQPDLKEADETKFHFVLEITDVEYSSEHCKSSPTDGLIT